MDTWTGPFPSIGADVCDYIETYCLHGPGPVSGQRVELTREEQRFIFRAYEYHPLAFCLDTHCDCHSNPDLVFGSRRFDWAVYSRMKGSRKSELASWVLAAELDGPCRVIGWDESQPIAGSLHRLGITPDIPVLATAQDQAEDTVWSSFVGWAAESPLADRLDITTYKVTHQLGGNARVLTSSSIARDGGRPTFMVAEEQHLWYARELKDLDATARRNLVKLASAQPWGLSVTTMFEPGEGSVAEEDFNRAFPESGRPDPQLLYDHREAPMEIRVIDEQGNIDEPALEQAIELAKGDCYWLNSLRIKRNYMRSPQSGERYWLNRRSAGNRKLVYAVQWDACKRTLMVPKGEPITLGFDGGETDDNVALIATTLSDGFQFPIKIWDPRNYGESLHSDVGETIDETFSLYSVQLLYADPAYWQNDLDAWSAKIGKTKRGRKLIVFWYMNRDVQLSWATKRWLDAIKTGTLTHSGDETFSAQVLNATRRTTSTVIERNGDSIVRGVVPSKEYRGSPKKIDACAAAILSWEARADCLAAGIKPKAKTTFSF